MSFPDEEACFPDNGGRRTGIERRHFCYSAHIPERRSGNDRRSGKDRRSRADQGEDNAAFAGPERREWKGRVGQPVSN